MTQPSLSCLPPRLLDLLGVELPPPRLSESVLLIIDAQCEYVDGRLPLPGIVASLAVGGRLVMRARALVAPVVHVLHRGGSPLFDPDASGYAPAVPLLPLPGEAVVEKTRANGFAGTRLAEVLAATARKRLIVIGYMTHNCISSTVRAALDLGYLCTVVADACGTRDLPDGRGGVIAAADLHVATLAGLADSIAQVVADDAAIGD
jgi:nicotinamidase-related amidase